MTDQDQLIAAAEVLGYGVLENYPGQLAKGGIKHPDYLASLDACFADIVPWMKEKGYRIDLWQRSLDEMFMCLFLQPETKRSTGGSGPTAPRAIVKAFLVYNNRWIE